MPAATKNRMPLLDAVEALWRGLFGAATQPPLNDAVEQMLGRMGIPPTASLLADDLVLGLAPPLAALCLYRQRFLAWLSTLVARFLSEIGKIR